MCDEMELDMDSDNSDSDTFVDDVSDNDFDIDSGSVDEIETLNFEAEDVSTSDELVDISDNEFDIDSDTVDEIETLDFDTEDVSTSDDLVDISDNDFDIDSGSVDEFETLNFEAEDVSTSDELVDISDNDFDIDSGSVDEIETLDFEAEDVSTSDDLVDISDNEFDIDSESVNEIETLDFDAKDERDDVLDSEFDVTPTFLNDLDAESAETENIEMGEIDNLSVEDNNLDETEIEFGNYSDIEAESAMPTEIGETDADDIDLNSGENTENLDYGDSFYDEKMEDIFDEVEGIDELASEIGNLSDESFENVNVENLNDNQADITEDTEEDGQKMNELNSDDLEQNIRDDAVNNTSLEDLTYVDENGLENQNETVTSELPQMTDEELATFVDWEHQHENGNYDIINNIMNDDSLTDEQKESMTQYLLDEIREAENETPEYGQRVKALTYDGRDIITRPPDLQEENGETAEVFDGELTEEDLKSVYTGLENYDFQGVDCMEDVERLDSNLKNFTKENWEKLDIDEQKEKVTDLAQYIVDVTGLENPPRIEFYNNDKEGDYGGFNRLTNTLSINEHMLYQNDEAADTVAHELWHALQYQRASNPKTKLDAMYAENFNDYISYNEDFEGYQSQLFESEARAFAQQIKDRLSSY